MIFVTKSRHELYITSVKSFQLYFIVFFVVFRSHPYIVFGLESKWLWIPDETNSLSLIQKFLISSHIFCSIFYMNLSCIGLNTCFKNLSIVEFPRVGESGDRMGFVIGFRAICRLSVVRSYSEHTIISRTFEPGLDQVFESFSYMFRCIIK